MEKTEERISKLKERIEMSKAEEQKENRLKKQTQRPQEYNKRSNIYVTEVLEGEKEKGAAEKVLEETVAQTLQIWQETQTNRCKNLSESQTE